MRELNSTTLTKQEKCRLRLLWGTAVFVNLCMNFFSYCTDSAYCVLMAYRMVQGDRLFAEMWEPHQTAALLPYLLVKLFYAIFGSTTGIVLWMHFCGTVIFALTAGLMIRLLRPYLPVRQLHYMALLFFVIRPKYVNMPDYANMSIVFSTLFWLCFVKYLLEKKGKYLVLSTCCAVAATFAYPSNALLIVWGVLLLFFYRKEKKSSLCMAAGSLVAFCGFALYVCLQNHMGMQELIDSLIRVFLSDSHSETGYYGWPYFKMFVYGLIFSGLMALIAYGIRKMFRKKELNFLSVYGIVLLISVPVCSVVMYLCSEKYQILYEWIYFYLIIAVIALVCGLLSRKGQQLEKEEDLIYRTGTMVSLCVLFGTAVLTNLSLITVWGYASLAVCCSLIPICSKRNKNRTLLFAFALFGIVSFHQVFICGDALGTVKVILQEENYVRVGPEKWLGTTIPYCNRVKTGSAEWQENVKDTDAVLIAETKDYQLTAYMFSEAEIANYSVISTPGFYEDNLREYWEMYPEKYPTVIAVPCYRGEESRHMPEWLSEFIDTEYECTYSGVFWNFYR